MELREFRVNVPAHGTVNVEFHLHFDTNTTTVGEIKIHADYNCGIPHRVQLKKDGDTWKLYDDRPKMVNGEVKVIPEYLEDDLSNNIVSRILEIRDAAN